MDVRQIRSLLTLYFVMGSLNCNTDPEEVLSDAIRGGITLFQFREKGDGALTGEDRIYLAKKLFQVCRRHEIPFIVNDDVELALSIEADGIHVGQDDIPAFQARKQAANMILGVSAHNLQEARQAIRDGADYLGVGPIYATTTKPDADRVKGPGVIRMLRENGIDVPVVGIGGIQPGKAGEVIRSGADGVAVVSAISGSDTPYEVAKTLKEEVVSS
ncbi:MAG: thiamine phosphate synthase [Bacillaceae bacterium]|nr:thiamine phosphate synthase [Bacillaceae bacterium]